MKIRFFAGFAGSHCKISRRLIPFLFTCFFVSLIGLSQSQAQTRIGFDGVDDQSITSQVSHFMSGVSDWYVEFNYRFDDNGGDSDFRGWTYANDLNAFGNPVSNPNDGKQLPLFDANEVYIGQAAVDTDARWVMGPNKTITVGRFRGEFANGSDAHFGNQRDYTISTLPTKAPLNVRIKSTGFQTVVVEWDKGTDIPDQHVEYEVFVGNNLVSVRLPASTREYTFDGLNANTTYTFGVKTVGKAGNFTHDFVNHTWNESVSAMATVQATTQQLTMTVSQGEFPNKTRLEWPSVAGGDAVNVRVERKFKGAPAADYEEQTILSNQASAWNDADAIPGVEYDYRVSALNSNGGVAATTEASGFMAPNGIIRGAIRSTTGTGVAGITVVAVPRDPIPISSPRPMPAGGYRTMTDAGGGYELRNIYYYDSAEFIVQPMFPGHTFDPVSKAVILDINVKRQTNIDFIDESALTISGQVKFPPASQFGGTSSNGKIWGMNGVKILVDGQDRGIITDPEGKWSFAVTDPTSVTFTPSHPSHTFSPTQQTVNVTGNVTGIDFTDQTTDDLIIRVQDACGAPLAKAGEEIPVIITHKLGSEYFQSTVSSGATGQKTITLPATNYELSIDPSSMNKFDLVKYPTAFAQLDTVDITVAMAVRDTVESVITDTIEVKITPERTVTISGVQITLPKDTTYVIDVVRKKLGVQPLADFTYFGPLTFNINWEKAGADVISCAYTPNIGTVNVLQTGGKYALDLNVTEVASGCKVEVGEVTIYDDIGDLDNPVVAEIKDGKMRYIMTAGKPNPAAGGAHPYLKSIYFFVQAGVRPAEGQGYWALIEGAHEGSASFVSRSPDLPDLIVHDPPGDGSYSWVSQGSEYSVFEEFEYERTNSNGSFADIILGGSVTTEVGIGFAQEFTMGSGVNTTMEKDEGRTDINASGFQTTYTFTETFSTSDFPLFTGHNGDVYIGKAFNQQFVDANIVQFDPLTCQASVKKDLQMAPGKVVTTFIYSEKHIKDVLLPQINFLAETLEKSSEDFKNQGKTNESQEAAQEAGDFRRDYDQWKKHLAFNAKNRDEALFIENISFSAGAILERSRVSDSLSSTEIEYTAFLDTTAFTGSSIEQEGGGLWNENSFGVGGSFRKSTTEIKSADTTKSFEVGFVLEDDEPGDFFSIDVKEDKAFKTYVFELKGGNSACPPEPNTKHRDQAKISIDPPAQTNITLGEKATFTVSLTNLSQSEETREYQVRVIGVSNADGATVELGGWSINNQPASFFLDFGMTSDITMTVERGPRAASYKRIGLIMYPPCEYELWQDGGSIPSSDTAYFDVSFQTACTYTNIEKPFDKWLVNGNSSNLLEVGLSGYDLDNIHMEKVVVEYKPDGQGWQFGREIYRKKDNSTSSPDSIWDSKTFFNWDISNLTDGGYELRAVTHCKNGQGTTASDPIRMTIDRASLEPFGIPTPGDGFLRLGQEISVSFDQDIECNFAGYDPNAPLPEVTLWDVQADTVIATQAQCSESQDKIINQPQIDLFDAKYKNVLLKAKVANIQNPSGNVQKYPAEWTFEVNASPVFWDPATLKASFVQGKPEELKSKLKNGSNLTKTFEIVSHPAWLTPGVKSGAILSNNEYEVGFMPSADLEPGTYTAQVQARIDGIDEALTITLTVDARKPNWFIDPSRFEYSATLVAAFNLTETGSSNLSEDERDLIAVMYNGEVRGLANLQFVPEVNKHLAFINIYSNIPANEELEFLMWRAESGVEYVASETIFFLQDSIYGSIPSPMVLHPSGVFQVIPLKQGWNWVSFNVETSDNTIHNMLKRLTSPLIGNNITVKRKDGKQPHLPSLLRPSFIPINGLGAYKR